MPTPPEPSGRSSSARRAAAEPSNDPGAAHLPPANGSTGSHTTEPPLSDIIRAGTGSSRAASPESDIAQFLANPPTNTDEQPTVITKQSGAVPNPNAAPPPPPPVVAPVSAAPPSIAGRRLGHFELIEAVGSGGMAAVLKARDTELGRVVALKILPPEAARDSESVARFKAEARAAAKLDHDNVARVYFCGEDQGLHFIAFEFVEGINLRQMMDRRGPLPAGECVRYMIQVAAGLNHAAERGVVHRDIKPSNILVTPDGRAKIVDMGLARHLGADVNGGVTQSGVTLGTFDYISPEQALDPRRADARSDIYSLGCAFYHALTGRPPVPDGTAARKLRAHQTEDPLDPRLLNPAIPDELAAVLARMMAKDPQKRYQTPNELIAHLKALAERWGVGGALPHDALAVPADPRVLPEPPQVRAWWVVAGAAVALAAVAFVIATGDPGPAPRPPGRDATNVKQPELPEKPDPRPAPSPLPAAGAPVRTVAELVRKLEDPTAEKVALAGETFDLTELKRGVTATAPKLELVGAANGRTRVVVTAAPAAADAAGALVFKATVALTVRNVWFEFKLDPDVGIEFNGTTQPVGLRASDAREVRFSDCLFTSGDVKLRDHDARAVQVTRAADGPAPQVALDRCAFGPGTVALAVPAGTTVRATDSGFAPHVACVHIDAQPDAPETDVTFDRCSLMLDPRCAAVDVPKGGKVLVRAGGCAFAPVGAPVAPVVPRSSANRRGVVVRARDAAASGVTLVPIDGHASAYYEVDPVATADETLTFEQCRTAAPGVDGTGHVELKQRPWQAADPLAALATDEPWRAFALKIATDPQLFAASGKRWLPLGAWFTAPDDSGLHRAYPTLYDGIWPPPRPLSAEEQARKVWFPGAPDAAVRPGVFKELSTLLKAAKPDDVILIRHTGELKVDNAEIRGALKPGEGELRLTFRPDEGARPVLVPEGDDDRDQTLFKLKSGEVTFENLHFVLRANRPKDGQTVAAVAVIGGKACRFVGCTFTLAEEDDSKVAAVHLPDIDKVMAMDAGARPVPKVSFEKCVLRGKGRGVWAEVSRPASASFTDSLTVLDGPVLLSEGGGKPGASGEAKFVRLAALVAGPLVELRGKPGDAKAGSGPVRYKVEADECLFVSVAGAGKPLAEVDGADPTDLKTVLDWQVKKANRYANFDASAPLAIVRPGTEGQAKELARDDWFAHAGEPAGADKRFGTLQLATAPQTLADLLKVKPADAAVKTADFPDMAEPKALEAGTDLKALPVPPE